MICYDMPYDVVLDCAQNHSMNMHDQSMLKTIKESAETLKAHHSQVSPEKGCEAKIKGCKTKERQDT